MPGVGAARRCLWRRAARWYQHARGQLRDMQATEALASLEVVMASRGPQGSWATSARWLMSAQTVTESAQTWCRYVDQHAHQEFMTIVAPLEQAELENLARYVDDFEVELPIRGQNPGGDHRAGLLQHDETPPHHGCTASQPRRASTSRLELNEAGFGPRRDIDCRTRRGNTGRMMH